MAMAPMGIGRGRDPDRGARVLTQGRPAPALGAPGSGVPFGPGAKASRLPKEPKGRVYAYGPR